MNKRLKKSAVLLLLVVAVTAAAGLIFPEQLAVLTQSENVVSERVLIPGGQSVGLQMKVRGSLIVGVENDAGPKIGDMIVAVNGVSVNSPDEVMKEVSKMYEDDAGGFDKEKAAEITVVRDKKQLNYSVKPYFDESTGTYKLGFWIKERIAGIGTLSFYDPKSSRFASLGHGIFEAETGKLLGAEEGKLLHTKVCQIKAGQKGAPGEIGGMIYDFEHPVGTIEKNTEFGVFGKADSTADFDLSQPMVMASADEVETGKAYILTTIDGTKVERFDIEITKVNKQYHPEGKGMEFQVTDRKLLASCGGIVQGMSGSPIIQKNRVVGAVTHVFVNNPQKGYGIFAQWMVEELDKR